MRKALSVLLALGLVVSAFAVPAVAQKKKKKAPKPVATQMWLHGENQIGETGIVDEWLDGFLKEMSGEEPEGSSSKSQFITNYVVGPNPNCDGNGLIGTVWRGEMSGRITGDVTVTLSTLSMPAAGIRVGLYGDGGGGCNESARGPDAIVDAAPAPGQAVTEVVLEDVDITVVNSLVLQVMAASTNPSQVRIFFDSASDPSNIEFSCIPATGQKSCI